MVITVEGYDYLNGAPFATSSLAAFSAMKNGLKTLVIELIDKDRDTVERILKGVGQNENFLIDREMRLAEEGIDQLLREADAQKIMKADFDRYVTPILTLENRLDVASITKTDNFTQSLNEESKLNSLKQLILNAKEVYDNIFILLPTNDKELCTKIRNLKYVVQGKQLPNATLKKGKVKIENNEKIEKNCVDASIFCIHQGTPKNTKRDVSGPLKKMVLVTEYDGNSVFNLKDIENTFIGRFAKAENLTREYKYYCNKLSYNIHALDSYRKGTLATFVNKNREIVPGDPNAIWIKDNMSILSRLFTEKIEEERDDWESSEFLEIKNEKNLERQKMIEEYDKAVKEETENTPVEAPVIEEAPVEKKLTRKELRALKKEEERQKKEMRKAELRRQEEIRRIQEEEERKRQEQLRAEEEERLRIEAERKRLEEERKRKEEEERIRLEEERKRREEERQKKLEEARIRKEQLQKEREEAEELQRLISMKLESITKLEQESDSLTKELDDLSSDQNE